MEALTDDSIMPFGKFKGKIMEDIPAWYLLGMKPKLETTNYSGSNNERVLNYINENIKVLDKQKGEEDVYNRGD